MKIQLEIDAVKENCHKCMWFESWDGVCKLFGESISVDSDNDPVRCCTCLQAEYNANPRIQEQYREVSEKFEKLLDENRRMRITHGMPEHWFDGQRLILSQYTPSAITFLQGLCTQLVLENRDLKEKVK